jgi:hypothetical protein
MQLQEDKIRWGGTVLSHIRDIKVLSKLHPEIFPLGYISTTVTTRTSPAIEGEEGDGCFSASLKLSRPPGSAWNAHGISRRRGIARAVEISPAGEKNNWRAAGWFKR